MIDRPSPSRLASALRIIAGGIVYGCILLAFLFGIPAIVAALR